MHVERPALRSLTFVTLNSVSMHSATLLLDFQTWLSQASCGLRFNTREKIGESACLTAPTNTSVAKTDLLPQQNEYFEDSMRLSGWSLDPASSILELGQARLFLAFFIAGEPVGKTTVTNDLSERLYVW